MHGVMSVDSARSFVGWHITNGSSWSQGKTCFYLIFFFSFLPLLPINISTGATLILWALNADVDWVIGKPWMKWWVDWTNVMETLLLTHLNIQDYGWYHFASWWPCGPLQCGVAGGKLPGTSFYSPILPSGRYYLGNSGGTSTC